MTIEKQVSSDRPRYYELDVDIRIDAIYEFVNKDRVFVQMNRSGSHVIELPGTQFKYKIGVPAFAERPEFILGGQAEDDDPLDYYGYANFILVSNSFKELIDTLAPDSIEAAICDARSPGGEPLPPYWWIDVVRVLDPCVDEERSTLSYMTDSPFASGSDADKLRYKDLQDIVFRQDVVGDAQLFRILRYDARPIVGERLADNIRDVGLTGMSLTPLQPPMPEEARDHLAFLNYPYWTNKGYGQ